MNILRITMDRNGNMVSQTEAKDTYKQGFRDKMLVRATIKGYMKTVKVLLALGANPSVSKDAPARVAVYYNRPEILKILLKDSRINLDRFTEYAMILGIQKGYNDVIDIALNIKGADPVLENNPIKYALALGKKDVVNKLLKDERFIDGLMEDEKFNRRMMV